MLVMFSIVLISCIISCPADAFLALDVIRFGTAIHTPLSALSSAYLENDLVAIKTSAESIPRLCAVKTDGTVDALCQREDDVETDLFADPREFSNNAWQEVTDDQVSGTYGEGWYGQRLVPSLGGGPGYGAEADEIWSVTEELIETGPGDGVDLPILDMGIAHGEKAESWGLFDATTLYYELPGSSNAFLFASCFYLC